MQCPSCLQENAEGAVSCSRCGAGLGAGEAPPSDAAQTPPPSADAPKKAAVPTGPVVLVIVGLLAVFVYFFWKAGGEPQVRAPAKCWACGYEETRLARIGEPTVTNCPKCGKQSLAPAVLCVKCDARVVLNEHRGEPPPTLCPKCGAEVRHDDERNPYGGGIPTSVPAAADR